MGALRRIALVAALAIVSSAVLPYAHGALGHATDCGVCSVLAHGGARVAESASAPEVGVARTCIGFEEVARAVLLPARDFDPRSARAPPALAFPT